MRSTTSRVSQLLFLLFFLILFVQTEYRGHDEINAAVNVFFRMDPLVLFSYLLATRLWLWLLLPALLTAVATVVLGRFFCGWICPLGTILDLVTTRIKKKAPLKWLRGRLKYWLLLPLLSASLFNLNLAGLLDPLAILLRGLTFFFYPLAGNISRGSWVELYRLMGERRDHLAPLYNLVRDNLLPFRDTIYPLAFLSAFLLVLIIFLERFETRNWCRNLCPLGTLLGWLGQFSLFRRTPAGLCSDCGHCRDICPTSFDQEMLNRQECIVCLECKLRCPHQRVSFRPTPHISGLEFAPERRMLLGSMAAGVLLAVPARFRPPEPMSKLIRPPGVRDESIFLKSCIRCGECMKVCLKNALYPAGLEWGLAGLYTPQVVPRLGYCEYNCTLCGQVCPTGAIPRLPVEKKRREVLGKAVFDKNHCLPFAKKTNCIVCEEHCPIPDKAIRSREVLITTADGGHRTLKEPYVVEDICNGCGICENVCPLATKPGIAVYAVADRTPIADRLSAAAPLVDAYGYDSGKGER